MLAVQTVYIWRMLDSVRSNTPTDKLTGGTEITKENMSLCDCKIDLSKLFLDDVIL